jgi:hypothetical protein
MKFLKLTTAILLVLFMVLTIVFFVKEDTLRMCFFGILSIWYLIDTSRDNIIDKLK